MIFDLQNTICNAQNISTLTNGGAVPTILSDKSIDLWGGQTSMPTDAMGNTPPHDFGMGSSPEIVITVTTAIGSSGSATVKCELVHADDEALTSNLAVLQDSGAIAKATLVAGYQWRFSKFPVGTTKRFIGCRFTGGGADLNAGVVHGGLVIDRQTAPKLR